MALVGAGIGEAILGSQSLLHDRISIAKLPVGYQIHSKEEYYRIGIFQVSCK